MEGGDWAIVSKWEGTLSQKDLHQLKEAILAAGIFEPVQRLFTLPNPLVAQIRADLPPGPRVMEELRVLHHHMENADCDPPWLAVYLENCMQHCESLGLRQAAFLRELLTHLAAPRFGWVIKDESGIVGIGWSRGEAADAAIEAMGYRHLREAAIAAAEAGQPFEGGEPAVHLSSPHRTKSAAIAYVRNNWGHHVEDSLLECFEEGIGHFLDEPRRRAEK